MSTFLCLPLDSTKLAGRIKLIKKIIKKRSNKRNPSKGKCSQNSSARSTKSTRSKSSKGGILSKEYTKSQIDLNEDKNVKLVSYSNLNINDLGVSEQCTDHQNLADHHSNPVDEAFEVKETLGTLSRVSSKASKNLESIVEEDLDDQHIEIESKSIIEDEEKIIVKEEKKIIDIENKSNAKKNSAFYIDDDIDVILHELHVNSKNLNNNQQSADLTSNHEHNKSCTLGTKHDDLNSDKEIISGTKCTANLQTNSLNDNDTNVLTNEQMDTAPFDTIEITKEVELIDDTNNVDEVDADNTNAINQVQEVKKIFNEIRNNSQETANQTNTTTNQPLNNQPIQTPVQQLQTNQTQTQTDTFVSRLNQDPVQPQTNPISNTTKTANELDELRKINKKLIQDTDLRTNPILNGVETWMELNKGSNCALGIDLIDRKINDEILFIIHEIIEKGIAETDQRLKVGDIVLQVNDIPLKNMSCEEALEHLNRTNGSVKLLIYRELICVSTDQTGNLNENCQNILNTSNKSNSLKINYSSKSTMHESARDENVEQKVLNGRLYEIIKVELQKKPNKGLGLCIVKDSRGDNTPGPYISEILPNSIAYTEGRLKKGDHIVNINGEDVTNQRITATITMLKCLPGLITLKVARLMPGQIVSLESFNRNQHQTVEPIELKFKVVVLNPNLKNEMLINPKRKPINDRLKELQQTATKDTDSVGNISLLNETVCNEWNVDKDASISTISKNWVKVDKPEADLDEIYIQQLEGRSIYELEKANEILEIDGHQLDESNSSELIAKLIDELKRSKNIVQLIVKE